MLSCTCGEDSIEHYACCMPFHRFCQRHLNLARPPTQHCLEDFLGISPWVDSLPFHLQGTDGRARAAALRAFAVYSLYRTHNLMRHNPARADAEQALVGYLREAIRGHVGAAGLLSSVFKRRFSED